MSGFGTTLPFKPGRMNDRLPSISANQASGCFVCFREVDHNMPVAEMVKVSGRRPSQVAGLGTGRRTETAHVGTAGSAQCAYGVLRIVELSCIRCGHGGEVLVLDLSWAEGSSAV
jgi:hypothetical protein